MIPTIEEYVKQVVDCITGYRNRIYSATSFARGKDMLGQKILAKWQIKNERAKKLKAIHREAGMFGYNLGDIFDNWQSVTKMNPEPEDYEG